MVLQNIGEITPPDEYVPLPDESVNENCVELVTVILNTPLVAVFPFVPLI